MLEMSRNLIVGRVQIFGLTTQACGRRHKKKKGLHRLPLRQHSKDKKDELEGKGILLNRNPHSPNGPQSEVPGDSHSICSFHETSGKYARQHI
jgi:hypothetical protein